MSGDVAAGNDRTREYEIRLGGHLGHRWAAWFDGLSLTNEDGGTTVIRGEIVDEAALHGLLRKVRDTGLPLLSVDRIDPDDPGARRATSRTPRKDTAMTSTVPTSPIKRAPMDPLRKTALVAGGFYLLTFAASLPAVGFLGPVLNNPEYVIGPGADTRVLVGCLLDLINAFACVGTAVALFPVVKRQSEGLALGFVTSRLFEAAVIVIGVVSLLAVVTLRQEFAAGTGADAATAITTARALVVVRDWTFLLGPGLVPAVNALLLGTLLYRSRLVPRLIPALGLVGGPLLLAANLATMFGLNEQVSVASAIALAPLFLWELSLGLYMTFKGFRPSPITSTGVPPAAPAPAPVPTT